MTPPAFVETFEQLRGILKPLESQLVIAVDQPGDYSLDAPHTMANGKPLFFGAARIGKRYVSFHLMPVYIWPEMLDEISDDLRKRMQGKSCFNFKHSDAGLQAELVTLTHAGFDRYRQHGYLG